MKQRGTTFWNMQKRIILIDGSSIPVRQLLQMIAMVSIMPSFFITHCIQILTIHMALRRVIKN